MSVPYFHGHLKGVANTPTMLSLNFTLLKLKLSSKFCDKNLPAIQEKVLSLNNLIAYAIATDPKGYVPTHNNKFAHSLTGNYEKDLIGSRSKRIFDDRTGGRCGNHTKRLLLQTYKRDTGEIMHDLSVPISVNGKHWGGFRVGYFPAK